eukprot:9503993-Pyramimonas_sp.AAC.4
MPRACVLKVVGVLSRACAAHRRAVDIVGHVRRHPVRGNISGNLEPKPTEEIPGNVCHGPLLAGRWIRGASEAREKISTKRTPCEHVEVWPLRGCGVVLVIWSATGPLEILFGLASALAAGELLGSSLEPVGTLMGPLGALGGLLGPSRGGKSEFESVDRPVGRLLGPDRGSRMLS